MSTWQIPVLFAMAVCVIGCLLGILRAIEKLAKGISTIGAELAKTNAKLESIEVAKPTEDTSFEDIEAALSNFEKLKRIDLTHPQGNKG